MSSGKRARSDVPSQKNRSWWSNFSTETKGMEIRQVQRKLVNVSNYGTDSGSDSAEASEGEVEPYRFLSGASRELTSIYWSIRKMIGFLRIGNQHTCSCVLYLLESYDYKDVNNVLAYVDEHGLEVLLNLSEVNDYSCRLTALRILDKLTKHPRLAVLTVDLGIAVGLVRRLAEGDTDISTVASCIITHIGTVRRVSRAIRKNKGIRYLTDAANMPEELLVLPHDKASEAEMKRLKLCGKACYALRALAKFNKNRICMRKSGLILPLIDIISSGNEFLKLPIMALLMECSTDEYFIQALEERGIFGLLVKDFQSGNDRAKLKCAVVMERAAAARRCAREVIAFHNGIEIIFKQVTILKDYAQNKNPLLVACLNMLRRMAIDEDNVHRMVQIGVLELMMKLFANSHDDVTAASSGVVAEMSKVTAVKERVMALGGGDLMSRLLERPSEKILCNLIQTLGEVSSVPEGIESVLERDGLRLIWSLLRHRFPSVRIAALQALKNCVKYAPDAGERLRGVEGSMHIIMELLDSPHWNTVTGACSVMAQVAKDKQNLVVLTQSGMVDKLAYLLKRGVKMPELEGVGDILSAISRCSAPHANAERFGELGTAEDTTLLLKAVPPGPGVLTRVCEALKILSQVSENCCVIQALGAVPFLLSAIDWGDVRAQQAAAVCLLNIRTLALAAEVRRLRKLLMQKGRRSLPYAQLVRQRWSESQSLGETGETGETEGRGEDKPA